MLDTTLEQAACTNRQPWVKPAAGENPPCLCYRCWLANIAFFKSNNVWQSVKILLLHESGAKQPAVKVRYLLTSDFHDQE